MPHFTRMRPARATCWQSLPPRSNNDLRLSPAPVSSAFDSHFLRRLMEHPMPIDFERKESSGGLTFKLYRGEGVALLAFDLTPQKATDDFVGFTVEVKYPGSTHWGALQQPAALRSAAQSRAAAVVQIDRSAVSEVPLDPCADRSRRRANSATA